jgi:hypothetical protein
MIKYCRERCASIFNRCVTMTLALAILLPLTALAQDEAADGEPPSAAPAVSDPGMGGAGIRMGSRDRIPGSTAASASQGGGASSSAEETSQGGFVPGTSNCAGFPKTILLETPWVPHANSRKFTHGFGPGDALVLWFKTPASLGQHRSVSMVESSDSPTAFRSATLSKKPCLVAKSAGRGVSISVAPNFIMVTGKDVFNPGKGAFHTVLFNGLDPNTVYYITVVNRNPDGSSGCEKVACNMVVDSNNANVGL